MNRYSYEQVRNVIQDGDIVFIYGKKRKPIQALIMLLTRSKLFHVGIAFWVGEGEHRRCLLIEAHANSKRRIVTLSAYDDYDMLVVEPPNTWSNVQHRAFKRVADRRYGVLEAAYIGIREALLKYLGVKIPPKNMPNEVCSEFVADTYNIYPSNISPQLLYELLMMVQKERVI